MNAESLESTFLKILKRLLLVAIGSGLLGNALYIYGLAYYQGYIERLGFEYNLFPIQWGDTLLWTYAASRELGVSSINLLDKFTASALLVLLTGFYFIARIWIQLSNIKPSRRSEKIERRINYRLAKKVYAFREKHLWLYRVIYVPVRWFLIKEQSLIAFLASYFFMTFLIFIPIFIIIWIYFPLFGVHHGELVAKKRIEYYKEYLCGGKEEYWNECIKIDVSHIKNYGGIKVVTGRLVFKSESTIGVMTEDGPITLSMPKEYLFYTSTNPCYDNECAKSQKNL